MHACPCVFMCEGGCICVVWVDVCACVSVYVEARDDLPPCSLRQGSHSNPELIHVASLPASVLWESHLLPSRLELPAGYHPTQYFVCVLGIQTPVLMSTCSNHWAVFSALTLSFFTLDAMWLAVNRKRETDRQTETHRERATTGFFTSSLILDTQAGQPVYPSPGRTDSIQTGPWPRRVKPKLLLPLYTRTVLGERMGWGVGSK